MSPGLCCSLRHCWSGGHSREEGVERVMADVHRLGCQHEGVTPSLQVLSGRHWLPVCSYLGLKCTPEIGCWATHAMRWRASLCVNSTVTLRTVTQWICLGSRPWRFWFCRSDVLNSWGTCWQFCEDPAQKELLSYSIPPGGKIESFPCFLPVFILLCYLYVDKVVIFEVLVMYGSTCI